MKALFIFAHPDDETFGAGGTIATLVRSGHQVVVITATSGQAGQTGEYGNLEPEELGKIRIQEQVNASKVLGISKTIHLGLMDGKLYQQHVRNIAVQLFSLIIQENPDIVITFEKHGASNHPDHRKISYATTRAFKDYMVKVKKHVRLYHLAVPKSYLVEYEKVGLAMNSFGKPKGTHDRHITTVIDISEVFKIKDQAAKCHKSQKNDWDRFLKRMQHVDLKKEFFELITENTLI